MHQTISEEYRELNRKLFEGDPEFGGGSFKWSDMVMNLRDDVQAETVLDYGCGRGMLKKSLNNPDWFREYDPAVEGKDEPPKLADLVVCSDVLEHIEPEFVDNVLEHIAQCAWKAAWLVIATRPADKILEDGRNAHLSLHDAQWWRERIERHFLIDSWHADPDEIQCVATTVREVGEIHAKSAVSDDLRYRQALRNCEVVPERIRDQPRHDRRCVLVCYGPSLKTTWHGIKIERARYDALIVSVSGAHDFLIERGIVPDIHIDCDPREHKAFFTKSSHPDVEYWMASCCHPQTIDQLLGRKLKLWHVYNSTQDLDIIKPHGADPGASLICGGGTVGCRALNLIYTQGYRSFSIYGMDCSFETQSGEQHAGPHTGKPQREWSVRVGDQWFRSSGGMVYTARGFCQNVWTLNAASKENDEPFIEGTTDRVELFLHGYGLLQEYYRLTLEKWETEGSRFAEAG